MDSQQEIKITTRDRLLRAWENSMELVRDFKIYSQEIKDDEDVAECFKEFAEDEGLHAARLREYLLEYEDG